MRIYIESTIPSYVVARPARDLLQAARQQLTRDWWDLKRHKHELFTSQVVLGEIGFGEKPMAKRRLETMHGLPLLQAIDEVKEFQARFWRRVFYRPRRTGMPHISRSPVPTRWIYF